MKINNVSAQRAVIGWIVRRPRLLDYAQKVRYVAFRGPLQERIVEFYRKRSKTASIALPGPSQFVDLDVDHTLIELQERGFSQSFAISPEQVHALLEYQESINAERIPQAHKRNRCIDEIARDPKIIEIARRYIGAEPILYACTIYLTGPKPGTEATPNKNPNSREVHFDASDVKDLNLFFYLNDVDEETSPHVYFEGTHRNKRFRDLLKRWFTREEMISRFGPRIRTVTGPAGTGFFEDTAVFHIQSVGRRGRYTISMCYTLKRTPDLARYSD